MQNLIKTPFLILCFILIVAHIKIKMKITVQSSNSNPVATDDTNITTILMFSNCTTGVWMIVDTGELPNDLSVEVIVTSIRIKDENVIQEAWETIAKPIPRNEQH